MRALDYLKQDVEERKLVPIRQTCITVFVNADAYMLCVSHFVSTLTVVTGFTETGDLSCTIMQIWARVEVSPNHTHKLFQHVFFIFLFLLCAVFKYLVKYRCILNEWHANIPGARVNALKIFNIFILFYYPNCFFPPNLPFRPLQQALHCKNMQKARELWDSIMTKGNAKYANMWLEYYSLERSGSHSTSYPNQHPNHDVIGRQQKRTAFVTPLFVSLHRAHCY